METEITKDPRHDHYWIEDGFLHESYHTIRGLRWRTIMEGIKLPDTDLITDKELEAYFKNRMKTN